MALKELEIRLSELDDKISELLKEREKVVKEWNIAFSEYYDAAEPPVRCSLSQSTDGTEPLLFCFANDGRM